MSSDEKPNALVTGNYIHNVLNALPAHDHLTERELNIVLECERKHLNIHAAIALIEKDRAMYAAAPEMAEALKEFIESGDNGGFNDALKAMARAALAKARII